MTYWRGPEEPRRLVRQPPGAMDAMSKMAADISLIDVIDLLPNHMLVKDSM